MLTEYNSGKYLSKKYFRLRNAGLENEENLTDSQKEYADIVFPEGGGSDDERTYVIKSRRGNNIDIRENVQQGDD